jgi:hypothetical protein
MAVDVLLAKLEACGYRTQSARSDWRVDAAQPSMLLRMVEECAAVAKEADPARAGTFDRWAALRTAQVAAGTLSMQVGHRDLLAVPRADREQDA